MDELVPLAGILSGLLITVAVIWGAVKLAHGPVGQALARRLQGRAAVDPEVTAALAELRGEVDTLRRELEETQERVDFAERLLSQGPSTARVTGPSEK